jgi:hypothetical protein
MGGCLGCETVSWHSFWMFGSAQEFDEREAGIDFLEGQNFGTLAVCETTT